MTKRRATAAEQRRLGLRDLAKGEACTNCLAYTPDVVLAHFSGIRQHIYGKGRSVKCDDWYGAPQCGRCHANGPFAEGWVRPGTEDWPEYARKVDKSEEQLHQIVMWHLSLMKRGLL